MANKDLLNKFGIEVNPYYEKEVERASTREVLQKIIDSTYRRGRKKDYFAIGLGSVLAGEGFADSGADILERVASVVTTRDFNLYSVLELVFGVGLVYLGIKARCKTETALKSLCSSFNEHYVEE